MIILIVTYGMFHNMDYISQFSVSYGNKQNSFSEIIYEIHNLYNVCNKFLVLKYDSQFKAYCN